ncbi:MAG: hypothetical protein KF679_16570 [Chitinophagaceae bacterium]|nr:hypothetical protein [Chitinophagaceae bacterium]
MNSGFDQGTFSKEGALSWSFNGNGGLNSFSRLAVYSTSKVYHVVNFDER